MVSGAAEEEEERRSGSCGLIDFSGIFFISFFCFVFFGITELLVSLSL